MDSDDIWNACSHFLQHLRWHKPRLVSLGPKIEGLPDDHPHKPRCLLGLLQALYVIGKFVVSSPQFGDLLQTISSERFEKLIIGSCITAIPAHWNTNDQVFCSFAERLYKLGAAKPLTMVLEFCVVKEVGDRTLDVQHIWPLFCDVGVIVEDYSAMYG